MHDLVSFLPLELIVQVVQHLDLEDVVRSQRVRTIPRIEIGPILTPLRFPSDGT